MPLLKVQPGMIPAEHDCGGECPVCLASAFLQPEDWEAIQFYSQVADQVVCITPMGDESGHYVMAPRLEGWQAAAELNGIPQGNRGSLVERARFLFEALAGRVPGVPGLFSSDPADLLPPEIDDIPEVA